MDPIMPPTAAPPPYIATQRLHVGLARVTARDLLTPTVFREPHRPAPAPHWRTIGIDRGRSAVDTLVDSWLSAKHAVRRCLCIAAEAGMGKSVALRRAQWFITQAHRQLLPILLTANDIPTSDAGLAAGPDARHRTALETALATRLRRDLQEEHEAGHPSALASHQPVPQLPECLATIRHHLEAGSLVVIIDGIDHMHTGESTSPGPKIHQVRAFHDAWMDRPPWFIVSGRPYSLVATWDHLLLDDTSTVAQPAAFDATDQLAYLGEDVYRRMRVVDSELLRIPRGLQRIREMALGGTDSRETLSSAADVYLHATEYLLQKGFNQQDGRAFRVLAAIACETAIRGQDGGVSQDDVEAGFLHHVFESHKSLLQGSFSNADRFSEAVRTLHHSNEGFAHSLIEPADAVSEIHWRDNTIRDYLAALWMLRHDGSFARFAAAWPLDERPFTPADNRCYWIWRFLAEASFSAPKEWMKARHAHWFDMAEAVIHAWTGASLGGRTWPATELLVRVLDRLAATDGTDRRDQCLRHFAGTCQILAARDPAGVTALLDGFLPLPDSPTVAVKRFPVTHAEYRIAVPGHRFGGDSSDLPVTGVTEWDARAFCHWLGAVAGPPSGGTFHLPDAAEWCHACLAGSQTRFARVSYPGKRPRDLDDTDIVTLVGKGLGRIGYRPLTQASPNAWGLYDMHGNVWEWTATPFADDPALRVCLGGSWKATEPSAFEADPASGRRMLPRDADDDLGFRPWRSAGPQPTPATAALAPP